ncbi:class E sortase [Haloechinothrix sp. YIM 98757]|uniref:Class E sortase n=1 Tax=Haloechinothrix aidingensis TaxID=2752311 RepID=A0A837ZZ31_9PSEU|nr:class E sortase [Haloechinothrix aidingensis]
MSQRPERGNGGRQATGHRAGYLVIRTAGELLITAGIVLLLFVFYTLYVTNWTSAQLQRESEERLEQAWDEQDGMDVSAEAGTDSTDAGTDSAFARIRIPAFGPDYRYTVQSGVDADHLEIGPGHYPQSALPGEPGNFGVAGHRIGRGAPFTDLDELSSCDALVVETATNFFVYRVLPFDEEIDGWESIRQRRPECANVPTLREAGDGANEPYGDTVGRRIVTPDRSDAVAPVPYREVDALPRLEQAALITLTTCHPQYSDRERLIVHGVLTQQVPKSQVQDDYGQLLEQLGEV